MDFITIIILAFLVSYSLYITINVFRSQAVEGTVISVVDEDHFDPNLGYNVTSRIPVYQFEFKGVRRTYKSVVGLTFSILHKTTRTLYVRDDGKVFEIEAIYAAMFAAVIVFFLGREQ